MDNLSLATEMYDSDPQYYQRVIQRSKTDFLRMAMRKRDYKLAERLINAGHFISLEPEIYNMSPLLLSLSAKDDLRLFKKMLGNIRSRDLEKGKGIPLALALLEAPEPFQLYVDRMAALNTDGKNTFVCELITATKDDRASFCKLASNEEKAYVSRLCGRFGC
jgi:hypothetical protein